jgi:aspartate aminotransferase
MSLAFAQPSATFALDRRVRDKIAAGIPVVHLAFGEAGLPTPKGFDQLLADSAGDNGYGSVAGSPEARSAAASYFERRGVPTHRDQIIFAPGTKPLLFALIGVLPGDVLLPEPSWVTYAAQATMLRKRVIPVPIGAVGGVPDPDALQAALGAVPASRRRHLILVLTIPDNPTGTIASPASIKRICEIVEEHDLLIISDEIYRDLSFEKEVQSPATLLPERTFVTNGLSKNVSLGGWRIGFLRTPDSTFGRQTHNDIIGVASQVWSSPTAPMQTVAAYVLSEPEPVRDHIAQGRLLHMRVALAAYEQLAAAGIDCRKPEAGFYLYPDLESQRPRLAKLGVKTADDLAELLLERFHVAVLSGAAFGDKPTSLRFRMGTSLLYGGSDTERWQALASDDPCALPWIRRPLDSLATAFNALSH